MKESLESMNDFLQRIDRKEIAEYKNKQEGYIT